MGFKDYSVMAIGGLGRSGSLGGRIRCLDTSPQLGTSYFFMWASKRVPGSWWHFSIVIHLAMEVLEFPLLVCCSLSGLQLFHLEKVLRYWSHQKRRYRETTLTIAW